MIGMQNKQHVQRALQNGVGPILEFAGLEQHTQKIPSVAQLIIRIRKRHAQAVPVRKRGQCRHLPDQPPGLLQPRTLVENILRVGVERRQRRDSGNHHAHRVRVIVKSVEKFFHRFVNERVVRNVELPLFQLRACRKLSV